MTEDESQDLVRTVAAAHADPAEVAFRILHKNKENSVMLCIILGLLTLAICSGAGGIAYQIETDLCESHK